MFQEDLEIEYTELGQQITNWVKDNISSDFTFRENQYEMIHNILSNIIKGNDSVPTHIIEAPTGSGKSLILIICAGVLADYYDKKSYILCSDLSLWKQYSDFIATHDKINKKFGKIKGASGNNYECLRNHHPIKYSECQMAKIKWEKLFNYYKAKELKFECANYCPYVKARKKALSAKVTLMTYQLYVHTISTKIVKSSIDPNFDMSSGFQRRDVIFCDECHNIPSIIQSTFGLTIKESHIENLLVLYKYAIYSNDTLFKDETTEKLENLAKNIAPSEKDLVQEFQNRLMLLKQENENVLERLRAISVFYYKFIDIAEDVQEQLSKSVVDKDYLTKDALQAYQKSEWLISFMKNFDVYFEMINMTGDKYLVKTISEELYVDDEYGRKVLNKYPINISFQCALENYMVLGYFLSSAPNQVLTSATIGGHQTFIDNCGIENHIYDVLPSTFNYDNSPIYALTRWKMSNNFKEKNFPYIKKSIYELCDRFKDYKGLIQTWTYDNAKEIFNNAPEEIQKRMLLYSGSQAKQELIEYHKNSKEPTILIGPTLNEGIDLPGDECRFIIMMKMPYPYIGDNLVKAKMDLFPNWYENETAKTVIQAIGRGIRSDNDWCMTYILDGCFSQLFNKTKDQFPMNIKERLKFFA